MYYFEGDNSFDPDYDYYYDYECRQMELIDNFITGYWKIFGYFPFFFFQYLFAFEDINCGNYYEESF